MSDRVAVYCATRNLYKEMITAAKSLLYHNRMDRIFFLIEDEFFPYRIPDCIHTINISNQEWFPHDGPNFNTMYSYMVLIRAAFSKIFHSFDRILSIDVDTIVNGNIESIFDTDLSGCFFAAVPEIPSPDSLAITNPYYNFGVALMNLRLFRDTRMDDTMIDTLNRYEFKYNEQDVMNRFCAGQVVSLDRTYNTCRFTTPPDAQDKPLIRHYAFEHPWTDNELYKRYENMSWEEVMHHR